MDATFRLPKALKGRAGVRAAGVVFALGAVAFVLGAAACQGPIGGPTGSSLDNGGDGPRITDIRGYAAPTAIGADALIERHRLHGARVGYVLLDLESGDRLAGRNEQALFIPASTAKVPAIVAAHELVLAGNAVISLERYLHVDLDLAFHEAGERTFRITEERRIRSREIHYFDNPRFGAVVLVTPVAELELETQLTGAKILDSFASPATISFWSLPGFIELLEKAGFSAQRHRLQWHRLLAVPLLFAAMVLLSAGFSLRHSRRGHVGLIMVLGMLAGFLLYFLSNFVHALGLSGKIPVILAGWAPAGISLMLGTTMLLHLEDG